MVELLAPPKPTDVSLTGHPQGHLHHFVKKRHLPKCKGLKTKTYNEKRGSPQNVRRLKNKATDKKQGELSNQKFGTVSSPKLASLN
jgi:hypothetical protein